MFLFLRRVSPPAEFCTNTFQTQPEVHRFPSVEQQHFTMQVSVAALPRQINPIHLPCPFSLPEPLPPPPTRRRMLSPVAGVAAEGRGSRSNSPSVSFGSYSRWRDETGSGEGGGLMALQSSDHMTRSKTYRDVIGHSDDSSDCSDSSVVTVRPSPSARAIAASPSMHAIRERTSSPKFYLPLTSSAGGAFTSDASALHVIHRPSPPIDYSLPPRDVSDSLSRRLATKLSFEPLPAFEYESECSKSINAEYASVKRIKLDPDSSYARNTSTSCTPSPRPNTPTTPPTTSTTHTNTTEPTQQAAKKSTNLTGARDDVTDVSSSILSQHQRSFTTPNLKSISQPNACQGNERSDATVTSRGMSHRRDLFNVAKTPEKPLKNLVSPSVHAATSGKVGIM